jgi:hypothetical protein
MWQLKSEQENKRIYTNPTTGSECSQTMCYTDKDGNKWYSFDDLTAIPYTRNFAATKISSLYSLGLSKDDLSNHVTGLKTILKSTDKDKYEKAYANLLDFESKANNATDAIKQMSSLVCVYFTINEEPIDSFDQALQMKKMGLLEADIDMHSFFLQRQIERTEHYITSLDIISKIASLKPNELSVLSE